MTELVRVGPLALLDLVPPPPLSDALQWLCEDVDRRAGHFSGPLVQGLVAAARQLAPVYQSACGPADPRGLEAWMTMVGLAVVNPPTDATFGARVELQREISGDLPAACWTRETLRAFLRRGEAARFWPAVADVDAFLRPIGRSMWDTARRLERVARYDPDPDSRSRTEPSLMELPEADRAAALRHVRSLVAGLEAVAPGTRRTRRSIDADE